MGWAGKAGGADSFWSRRMLEWMIVAAVVLAVIGFLLHQTQMVRGQAELAAIRSTLAALRTALVIDHLKRSTSSADSPVVPAQADPFELLEKRPINFIGVLAADEVERLPPGNWMFDPACPCLAYRPLDMAWFLSPDGSGVAWFNISARPAPLMITARAAYQWRGEMLD